jgi:hypothetical protein
MVRLRARAATGLRSMIAGVTLLAVRQRWISTQNLIFHAGVCGW